jgi:hypothetical protein
MPQVDELDERLALLEQQFADLGLITRILRDRIAATDRLREPLRIELESLVSLIGDVLPLLEGSR